MGTLIVIGTVFLILICLALIGLILIQQGKGGGLIALGGGGVEQAFGAHAATMAQKATAVLGILFLVLVIVMVKLHQEQVGPAPVFVPPAGAESDTPGGTESPEAPVGAPAPEATDVPEIPALPEPSAESE